MQFQFKLLKFVYIYRYKVKKKIKLKLAIEKGRKSLIDIGMSNNFEDDAGNSVIKITKICVSFSFF